VQHETIPVGSNNDGVTTMRMDAMWRGGKMAGVVAAKLAV